MDKALILCLSFLFLPAGPAWCRAAEEGAAAAGYGAAGELPAPPSVWAGTDAQKEYLVRFFAIKAGDEDAEWRASELNNAIELLARLPVPFRSCTRGLRRVKAGRKEGVKGYVEMNVAPVVFLTSEGADYRGISGWLVHEMTHCFQMAHPEVLEAWENKFWSSFVFFSDPKTPSATPYGNSSSEDDMAESVRKYLQLGKGMASSFPDRYEFIRVNIMAGVEFEPQSA